MKSTIRPRKWHTDAMRSKETQTNMQRAPHTTRSNRHWSGYVGTILLTALAVAGYSSVAEAASTPPFGAASGSVASISGTSMEVQSASAGQTTVTWATATTFSKTVSLTTSGLAAGDCISVTGTAAKKSKTTITARTITVTAPSSSGSCTAGRPTTGAGGAGAPGGFRRGTGSGGGGFTGGGGGGGGGFRGSGSHSFAGLANLAIGSGKVISVKGSSISLSGILLSGFAKPAKPPSKTKKASKPTKPVLPKTEKLKINTSKTTTVSQTQSTTSSSLAMGDCVTAFGPESSTGAVAATRVTITSTGSTTCSSGFGGGFGGGGFGGGSGGG
jgi:hypothetical protein